jgi:hypothetical protein
MTVLDIQHIEQALSVKLPAEYQQLLVSYPFSDDSSATACMVIRDPAALINVNRTHDTHFMIHHRAGRWVPQKNHFMIGNDGGEARYYLDLNDPECTVFRFDLETGQLSPYAKGIAEYRARIEEMDRETEADENRLAKKRRDAKWWEIWKRL